MTRVYTDMVADLFHYGHVEFLRRARELGDELVVGIHSDATVSTYKRTPMMTMDERAAVVAACRYVDEVITDAPLVVTSKWITRHHIDLVVHGDDSSHELLMSMYRIPHEQGILRTLPYTAGISSTDIVRRIVERCAQSNGRRRP